MHIGIWPETKRKKKNNLKWVSGQLVVLQVLLIKKKKKKKTAWALLNHPDGSGPPFPQLENENSGLITKTPVITKMLWLYKRNKTSQVLKRMRIEARQNFASWIK